MYRIAAFALSFAFIACTSSSMTAGDDTPTPDGNTSLPAGGQAAFEGWCKKGIAAAAMCGSNPACTTGVKCSYDVDCSSGLACNSATGQCMSKSAYCVGIPYLERAIRLLERGKVPPDKLGRTQFRLAQFVYAVGRTEHARGRSIAANARATVVAAGPAGAKTLAEIDAFLASHP